MKKILLTLTAVAGLALVSNAQEFGFEKGNFIVEGSLGASSLNNKNDDSKLTTFQFTPKVGYFVTDKVAVGIDFGFGQDQETTYPGVEKVVETDKAFSVGVFGRYYFLDLGSRFKAYTEAGVGYVDMKSLRKVGSNPTGQTQGMNGFGANAGVGVNYFLTDNIAINFALADIISYQTLKADKDGSKPVSAFSANINVFNNFFNTAHFGLAFKF